MEIIIDMKQEHPLCPRVIIQCQGETEEVIEILQLLESKEKKIIGFLYQKEYFLKPKEVLYVESVDGSSYIYTSDQVYKTNYSLLEFESQFSSHGFFRCSKSVVLNIHAIDELKSEMGNRIDARLQNGEHIIISRRYAKELRAILKGEEEL